MFGVVLVMAACSAPHRSSAPFLTSPLSSPAVTDHNPGPGSSPSPTGHSRRIVDPSLQVDRLFGPVGTVLRVEGRHCPRARSSQDNVLGGRSLYWHDSYQRRHKFELHRGFAIVHIQFTGNVARGTYRIPANDSLGRGLLVLDCGGGGGNAVGFFTVTG
jgi:hypothetical protein